MDEKITTRDLARNAGYSTYHFIRIFKDVTGISPRHFLSALRIEKGKQMLADSYSPSIVKTSLETGFQSVGTFSTTFKNSVGVSPKTFLGSMNFLHSFMNTHSFQEDMEENFIKPAVICHLEVPDQFQGIVFAGLFPEPIPESRPVVGTALKPATKKCIFSKVSPGIYYLLSAAISWSINPKDYFLLSKSLRGKSEHPIHVLEDSIIEVSVRLREPIPFDPPILVNLPLLLFEKETNRNPEEN